MNASGVKWVSMIVSDECSFGMIGEQIKINKHCTKLLWMSMNKSNNWLPENEPLVFFPSFQFMREHFLSATQIQQPFDRIEYIVWHLYGISNSRIDATLHQIRYSLHNVVHLRNPIANIGKNSSKMMSRI